MTDKAKQIIDSIKQACNVFAAMELPMAERECTLSYDAVMTLVKEMETIQRERDAAVEDMKGICSLCAHERMCEGYWCGDCNEFDVCEAPCKNCDSIENWQWRGVKE